MRVSRRRHCESHPTLPQSKQWLHAPYCGGRVNVLGDQFCFNGFVLRPAERLLLRGGEPVRLGGRAFDLLVALVERRDRVVEALQLIDLVWGTADVEPANLQVQICALRQVLGRQAIATVERKGYRFTARVSRAPSLGCAEAGLEGSRLTRQHPLAEPGLVTVVGRGTAERQSLAHALARDFASASRAIALWFALPARDDLEPMLRQLSGLGHADAVVVIEGCDRRAPWARQVVESLCTGFPHLRILALAKAPLRLDGERVERRSSGDIAEVAAPDTRQAWRWPESMRAGKRPASVARS